MVEHVVKVCFERIIPPQYQSIAFKKAKAENPANVSEPRSSFEAAVLRSKLWKPGRTLRVRFMDGLPEVQAKVRQYATQWTQYANLAFNFGDDPEAEIRISFKLAGSWSFIGTDALVEEYCPKNEPTMNFGWLEPGLPEEEYPSVVLHEFGHAIGMIHEHQNPAGGIQWNEPAVIKDLSGPPNNWDEATIRHNVLEHYSEYQTQFTDFDAKSIMLYTFPKSWTLNEMEFPRNVVLSETDKTFMQQCYPK